MNQTNRDMEHNPTIDCLRGVAALAVCCCHSFVVGSWKSVAGFRWLGVYIFFVVFGFIGPYSLARSSYTVRAYPRSVAKRMVRLNPPYLISICFAITLRCISYQFPQFHGPVLHYAVSQILPHFGQLNSFFGGNWIIIIYWTLGIEFQYYLIAGLIYPALITKRVLPQIAIVAVCALGMARLSFPLHVKAAQGPLITHYGFVVLLVFFAFRYKIGVQFAAAVVSIGAAWFIARLVEEPAKRLASRIQIWTNKDTCDLRSFDARSAQTVGVLEEPAAETRSLLSSS